MKTNLPIYIIVIPFLIAFIISFLPKIKPIYRKLLVLIGTLLPLLFVAFLIKPVFLGDTITYWLGDWKPFNNLAIGIGLYIDPLSIFLGIIISFNALLSAIYSFRYLEKDTALSKYYTLFLILTGSMLAFVFSADLFNMYVFLEVMTIAAISLTAFREHKYQSIEASFKYLIIGTIGSCFVLLGVILLYSETGTLNLSDIGMLLSRSKNPVEIFAFASLLTGFGVKAFLVPLHTWPPDAHMAAPSSISMILSGILSKTGVYALIRILYFVFKNMDLTAMQNLIVTWGTITMLVGVSMALLQHDYKRLLAFHSVSQIGYVITGIGLYSILGITGGLYHLLNHVLFKCLLFLTAGAILYKCKTTDLEKLGGLAKKMPWTFTFFIIGALSISGIPPFNGFTSKWLIYCATLASGYFWVTIIALLVSILTLASFMKVMYSAFLGKTHEEHQDICEVPLAMLFPMGILSLGCIITGIFPEIIITKILHPVTNCLLHLDISSGELVNIGFWNPLVWLITFFIILLALIFFFSFYNFPKKNNNTENIGSKYEVFTGGELIEETNVGPDDLYFGLKKVFKPYFSFLRNSHSGLINDYVMWVILTAVILNVYFFIFI